MIRRTISPSDPEVILAGIKQFGLAPDGSDLQDLASAIARLRKEAIQTLREPNPPDAEVWECPCCLNIVDREFMIAVAKIDDDPK